MNQHLGTTMCNRIGTVGVVAPVVVPVAVPVMKPLEVSFHVLVLREARTHGPPRGSARVPVKPRVPVMFGTVWDRVNPWRRLI